MRRINIQNNITIAIPVYDRYEFFEDAINSAINQTVPCNVLVVDNNSAHTQFEDYVNGLGLKRVTYVKNETNVGAINNWNKCIELTTTDWVTILHSDDMLSPSYIESMCMLIEKYPRENAFLVSDEAGEIPSEIFINQNEISFKERLKERMFLLGNYAGFPGNIFRKSYYNIRFKDLSGASDYAFWYEMATHGSLKYVKNILAFYRVSASQDSATMDIQAVVIIPVYLVRRDQIGFGNLFMKIMSMYELFQLYRYYQKSYRRPEEHKFQFAIQEINSYFQFFDKPASKILLFPIYKVLRFLIKKCY